jgi:hypothetical protein
MNAKLALVIAIAVTACRPARETPADTGSVQVISSPVVAVPRSDTAAPLTNRCEHNGLWAECSLERRLKQAGFVVKKLDERPVRAGFSIKPVVYSLGASRLEVFFYKDETSANKEIALLDTVVVAPKGSQSPWPSTPTLIRSANLAAVLLSQNARQAERVMLAITAGAPQPGSPR